jgi:hypothetical protein
MTVASARRGECWILLRAAVVGLSPPDGMTTSLSPVMVRSSVLLPAAACPTTPIFTVGRWKRARIAAISGVSSAISSRSLCSALMPKSPATSSPAVNPSAARCSSPETRALVSVIVPVSVSTARVSATHAL